LAHELLIAVRGFPAQAVVEVGHDEFGESRPLQKIEENDRVDSAGNTDQRARRGKRGRSSAAFFTGQESFAAPK
jgi:hypothetical protein